MPFLRVLPFRRVTNVILVAPGAAAVPFSGDGSIPWSPSRHHPVDPLLLLEDDLARAASTRSRSENLGRRELADVRGAVGKEEDDVSRRVLARARARARSTLAPAGCRQGQRVVPRAGA